MTLRGLIFGSRVAGSPVAPHCHSLARSGTVSTIVRSFLWETNSGFVPKAGIVGFVTIRPRACSASRSQRFPSSMDTFTVTQTPASTGGAGACTSASRCPVRYAGSADAGGFRRLRASTQASEMDSQRGSTSRPVVRPVSADGSSFTCVAPRDPSAIVNLRPFQTVVCSPWMCARPGCNLEVQPPGPQRDSCGSAGSTW